MKPYIYLEPVVVDGLGEIHGEILQDAATLAEYHLEVGGGVYALADLPELDRLIAMKTWRSPAALDVKLRIQRQAALELSASKDVKHSILHQVNNPP